HSPPCGPMVGTTLMWVTVPLEPTGIPSGSLSMGAVSTIRSPCLTLTSTTVLSFPRSLIFLRLRYLENELSVLCPFVVEEPPGELRVGTHTDLQIVLPASMPG